MLKSPRPHSQASWILHQNPNWQSIDFCLTIKSLSWYQRPPSTLSWGARRNFHFFLRDHLRFLINPKNQVSSTVDPKSFCKAREGSWCGCALSLLGFGASYTIESPWSLSCLAQSWNFMSLLAPPKPFHHNGQQVSVQPAAKVGKSVNPAEVSQSGRGEDSLYPAFLGAERPWEQWLWWTAFNTSQQHCHKHTRLSRAQHGAVAWSSLELLDVSARRHRRHQKGENSSGEQNKIQVTC